MFDGNIKICTPTNYHVALYMRVSKEDERDGYSQSIQNQNALLQEFIKEHHLCMYDCYIDDGWSGTNFERPQFQRMLTDIEAKKINMVITKDLSRLGRDYIMIGHYMERYFPEHQVRYISLLDGIDTGIESTSNDIMPFRAIMNDMYAKDISHKIKSVKRAQQRKGIFIGGKPVYGYKMHPTEKNKIVIDDVVAPVVQRIFSMALLGMSCRKIATYLNEHHIPTPATYAQINIAHHGPYAGLWSSERISDMLQNQTYIGNMVQGRSIKVSYKSKKCHKQRREDWIVVEGTHTPIVDQETFAHVQRLLESRKYTRNRTYDFLLKGLIFCHECGYPLGVLNRKNAAGEDVLYFVCRTYQRFTKAGVCTCHSIKEKTVTDVVLSKVQELCKYVINPSRLHTIADQIIKQDQYKSTIEAELYIIQNAIEKRNADIEKLYIDYINQLLTKDDFQRMYQQWNTERKDLKEREIAYQAQKENANKIEDQAQQRLQQFLDSLCTNRELLVNLIERVELTTDKEVIIHFRFAKPECF